MGLESSSSFNFSLNALKVRREAGESLGWEIAKLGMLGFPVVRAIGFAVKDEDFRSDLIREFAHGVVDSALPVGAGMSLSQRQPIVSARINIIYGLVRVLSQDIERSDEESLRKMLNW